MKIKSILYTLFVSLVIFSCLPSRLLSRIVAKYDIGLLEVESPADAKLQFGETKVVSFNEEGKNKYKYEDDYIDIIWYAGAQQFYFVLKNKTNHSIKINWDDISYVDINGQVGRVMHSGVKYNEKNNSQPATTIPKGASISDILLPTDNVYLSLSTWQQQNLIPSLYKTKQELKTSAPGYVGKTMKIFMPILIENVQNDYTFTFIVEKLLNTIK